VDAEAVVPTEVVMGRTTGWFLGGACLLALTVPLRAQAPKPQPLPVFGVGVHVVAVPVFVTDKSGQAVPGLVASDFEIEDQGKKVPLVAFQAVDAEAPTPAAEAGPLVQAAARRQFLFLFDLTFSTPTGIMRAREAAGRFVASALAPSDLAAAATFGQTGVQLLVGFTSDRAQLGRAIEELGLVETQPRVRDPLRIAYDLGAPLEGPGLGSQPPAGRQGEMIEHLKVQAQQMARGEQAYYRQRVDNFLGGFEELARALGSVQGRKQVVLLSGGFDSAVLGGAQGQEAAEASRAVTEGRLWDVQSDRHFGDSEARDALDKLFRTLAGSDTVIHSVDVAGLAAGGAVDEAVPGRLGQGRDTLAQFAANTGGRFVKDANDLEAGLAEVLAASRHYYVVAFEPLDPGKKLDRLRKLKVRVRRDGLSVSHRAGYVLPDPKRQAPLVAAQLQAAEAITKGVTGGPIPLRAVAVPYRDAKGRLALPVVLELDGAALLHGISGKQLQLEVYGYALDAGGRVQDVFALTPALDLDAVKPALQAKGLQVLSSFAVAQGTADLRFVVRDKASGRAGSLRLPLEVPAFGAGQVVLSPPLAMDDPRARLVVPAASRARPQLDIPFRLGDAPFTAEPLPVLRNGAPRELCVLAWSGARRYGTQAAFDVEARLVDAAGSAFPLPLDSAPRVVEDADGLQRYVLTLTSRDVPRGVYSLDLGFRDRTSGATTHARTSVQVE
jgi:VWFA-related protein